MMVDHHTPSARPDGEPACSRTPLVEAITTFLAHERAPAIGEIRESLELAIDEAGPDALAFLGSRLASAGTDWRYYPRDWIADGRPGPDQCPECPLHRRDG